MQVPESFFYGRSPVPEGTRRKDGEGIPGDEIYRKELARDRRQTKPQSEIDARANKGKSFSKMLDPKGKLLNLPDDVDVEQPEEFSLFEPKVKKAKVVPAADTQSSNEGEVAEMPEEQLVEEAPEFFIPPEAPKPLKAEKRPFWEARSTSPTTKSDETLESESLKETTPTPAPKAPIKKDAPKTSDWPPSLRDVAEEEPEKIEDQFVSTPENVVAREGKEMRSEKAVFSDKQVAPDKVTQEENVNQQQQVSGFVVVEKKDRKEELKSPTQPSMTKTTKNEAKASEMASVEKSMNKPQEYSVDEREARSPEQIFVPGTEKQMAHVRREMDKQQPENMAAMGNDFRNIQDKPKLAERRPVIADANGSQAAKDRSDIPTQESKQPIQTRQVEPQDIALSGLPSDTTAKDQDTVPLRVETPVQRPPLAHRLQEIVDQIVKEIYTVKLDGNMETHITLSHPPLFKGVTVTVKTFENAPKEMNITFSNLTTPGKRVLDENLGSLRAALEHNEKGFVVHQIITTTLNEVPRYQTEAGQPQKERDSEGQQQKRDQQQEEKQNENKKK